MHYAYILSSLPHPDQRYIGSTSNLRTRLAKHNAGQVPHTSKFLPWKVETYIAFETPLRHKPLNIISNPAADTPSPQGIFDK